MRCLSKKKLQIHLKTPQSSLNAKLTSEAEERHSEHSWNIPMTHSNMLKWKKAWCRTTRPQDAQSKCMTTLLVTAKTIFPQWMLARWDSTISFNNLVKVKSRLLWERIASLNTLQTVESHCVFSLEGVAYLLNKSVYIYLCIYIIYKLLIINN